ncbi:MAG: ComEC/Rec2 family competence protein [Pseudomonadota bacterium]
METLRAFWMRERPAAALWIPVFFGLGVQLYFWAQVEPSGLVASIAVAAPILIWSIFWRRLRHFSLLGLAATLIALGLAAGVFRSHMVAAPILKMQTEATVEGVVREVSRTRTGRPRLVLDQLIIFGVPEAETPRRAQIALLRSGDIDGVTPGDRVSIFANLGPPGGPVEPGGFDYRRTAWFLGLGAVGYARGAPVEIAAEGVPSLPRRMALALARERARIAEGLRERLPGETGAFAAAVTVGERAGIPTASLEALRQSNLAHLLAISGLHMGLVTALVFGGARLLLALTPVANRRWRTKRIAAGIALAAAVAYLALSGASIATQRAFIMAAVALIAVMLNRPAITLRALAVAALIILAYRPESLTHVGFQMSFAATAAIIAGFDFARERGWVAGQRDQGALAQVAAYGVALLGTSLLAGAATAPFSAFHFNQMAHYGLMGNLAAVPIMGFVVAPAGVLAAVLLPVGLEGPALLVMSYGIEAILAVAVFVAGLDGAVSPVAAAPKIVLTLVAMGGLGLVIGRSALRVAGAVALVAGLGAWFAAESRPEVLIAPEGRLAGVMGADGRALDHKSSASYAASIWLRRDGDRADQETAARRWTTGVRTIRDTATLSNGWRVTLVPDRRISAEDLNARCRTRTVLIAPHARRDAEGPCVFYGRDRIRRSGALAVRSRGADVEITAAEALAGQRYWTMPGGRFGVEERLGAQ